MDVAIKGLVNIFDGCIKYKIKELQKRNILDQNFVKYLKKKKKIFIIGPEILELYERQECLDDLLLNFNSVDLWKRTKTEDGLGC